MKTIFYFDQSNVDELKRKLREPNAEERASLVRGLNSMVYVLAINNGQKVIETGILKAIEEHGIQIETVYIPFVGRLESAADAHTGVVMVLDGNYDLLYYVLES